ncbi:MAG TPA: four helix bundle protein [Vicinamibacterales bacterium]|nr:four helix bundle protein [Vicinamibacterales bacterium]
MLDAARQLIDEINALIANGYSRLYYDAQLHAAAESIAANIREGYGRRPGPERNQFLRYARGSAEETDEHLAANFRSNRLEARTYWRFHNRILVMIRMLNSLMQEKETGPSVAEKARKRRSR